MMPPSASVAGTSPGTSRVIRWRSHARTSSRPWRPGPPSSRGNERQFDGLFADRVVRDELERRMGMRKIRFAPTQHERAKIETVFVDESEIAKGTGEFGPGNVDLAVGSRFQSAYERLDVVTHERSVGADRL